MDYNVDIVMCIDLTSSMKKYIDLIKIRVIMYGHKMKVAMYKCGRKVSSIRIRIIGFRDFEADGRRALEVSRFFNITHQMSPDFEAFKVYCKGLAAEGWCEGPKNSLEALTLAIQSDWVQTGDKRRHVIVMFTDASAHKLEDANRSNPNYPENMPESFEELTDVWMTPSSGNQGGSKTKLKQPAKRLIVFGPEVYPWPELYESWDNVCYVPWGCLYDDLIWDDLTSEDFFDL